MSEQLKTIHVPEALFKRVKLKAVKEGIQIREAAIIGLTAYVEGKLS